MEKVLVMGIKSFFTSGRSPDSFCFHPCGHNDIPALKKKKKDREVKGQMSVATVIAKHN